MDNNLDDISNENGNISNLTQPPLYDSIEESSSQVEDCILCGSNVDNELCFGEKIVTSALTAHFFCLVG